MLLFVCVIEATFLPGCSTMVIILATTSTLPPGRCLKIGKIGVVRSIDDLPLPKGVVPGFF